MGSEELNPYQPYSGGELPTCNIFTVTSKDASVRVDMCFQGCGEESERQTQRVLMGIHREASPLYPSVAAGLVGSVEPGMGGNSCLQVQTKTISCSTFMAKHRQFQTLMTHLKIEVFFLRGLLFPQYWGLTLVPQTYEEHAFLFTLISGPMKLKF